MKKEMKNESKEEARVRVLVYIPHELHLAFKLRCVREETTMKEVMEGLLKGYMKDYKAPK